MAIATRMDTSTSARARRLAGLVDWGAVAPGLMSFALLASLGMADGGLFPRTWRLASLALLALAGAALLVRRRVTVGRVEWAMLLALAGFAVWIAVSAVWSGSYSADAERALLYVVGVFAVLVVTERRAIGALLVGALCGIALVAGYGLAVYLFTSPALDPIEGRLLFQPLGYANALGIYAAIGILLAIGLALSARRRAPLLLLVVLLPTLYFTASRGAALALLGGLACLLCLGGRVPGRIAAVTVAGGTIAVAAVLVASGGGALGKRPDYWRVAVTEYAQNPVLGSGAGTYVRYWLRERPDPSFTRTAHSLYLESLAELGPVGLVLVVAAVGAPLLALRRRRDPLLATAAAGYAAYLLHAGIDWDWEMPAVTLAGLFCGCALLVSMRPHRSPGLSTRARASLLAGAVAVAAFVCVRLVTGGGLPLGA